jgi:hypothetical protein
MGLLGSKEARPVVIRNRSMGKMYIVFMVLPSQLKIILNPSIVPSSFLPLVSNPASSLHKALISLQIMLLQLKLFLTNFNIWSE